jgi:hypothetical protein
VAVTKRNSFLVVGGLISIVLVGAGVCLFLSTRDADIEFTQGPNSVEAHEAKRKLALFDEAQTAKRKGFVRLTEVEINSFLEEEQKKDAKTNAPVRLVKTGVLLNPPNLTVVTWHNAHVLGMSLPFTWQRTMSIAKSTNGWSLAPRQMRLGTLSIPERCWPCVENVFGSCDRAFDDREQWLAKLPAVTLSRNEESKLAELRLYTYIPERWHP